MDQTNWQRVVDHTDKYCRSWQFLYIPTQAIRYIRLVGTYNIAYRNANKFFTVIALEAMYTEKPVPTVNGIVAPSHNVATVDRGATVINQCDILLNGNTKGHDYVSGDGGILVQLGQPYWIGSVRLLLYDRERSYKFCIQTSTDPKQWNMVVDKRSESLTSWQQFTFDPRVVAQIAEILIKKKYEATS